MPAPTALLQKPEEAEISPASFVSATEDDGGIILDPTVPTTTSDQPPQPTEESSEMQIDPEGAPLFPPAKDTPKILRVETRKVLIPPHRFTPLKASWPKLYPPLVNHLKLQVRMNVKSRCVELRTSKHTTDNGALQKGEDYVRGFALGFDLDDAIAFLRLDDLFVETFEVKDVKTLTGDHLSRAIGRIAGKDGKTKFAIENASKTRIVLADSKSMSFDHTLWRKLTSTVHIMGGFQNIRIARETVVSLILGAPPGKVYHNLRTISTRMKERF
jgi:RNA-binding protein PNO1